MLCVLCIVCHVSLVCVSRVASSGARAVWVGGAARQEPAALTLRRAPPRPEAPRRRRLPPGHPP
eukprot:1413556-Rhodomonas_salina.3